MLGDSSAIRRNARQGNYYIGRKVIGRFINAVQRKIESKAETLVDALPIFGIPRIRHSQLLGRTSGFGRQRFA